MKPLLHRPTHSRRLYLPSLWVWGVWLLFTAGLAALFSTNPALEWRHPVAVAAVAGVVLLVGSLLIGQVLWWLSERRHAVFDLIFVGILGCGFLAGAIYSKDARYAHEQELARQMEELRDALRKRQNRRAAEALDQVRQRERLQADARFERYRDRLSADEIETLRALDREMLDQLDAAAERYRKTLRDNAVSGPARWLRMTRLDELEVERAAQLAIYEQTRVFMDFLDRFGDAYAARIEAAGLSERARLAAIAEKERILQDWEALEIRELRELDVAIAGVAVELITLLIDNWGRWQLDPESNQLDFVDPALREAFMVRLEGLRMLSRRQDAIRAASEVARPVR